MARYNAKDKGEAGTRRGIPGSLSKRPVADVLVDATIEGVTAALGHAESNYSTIEDHLHSLLQVHGKTVDTVAAMGDAIKNIITEWRKLWVAGFTEKMLYIQTADDAVYIPYDDDCGYVPDDADEVSCECKSSRGLYDVETSMLRVRQDLYNWLREHVTEPGATAFTPVTDSQRNQAKQALAELGDSRLHSRYTILTKRKAVLSSTSPPAKRQKQMRPTNPSPANLIPSAPKPTTAVKTRTGKGLVRGAEEELRTLMAETQYSYQNKPVGYAGSLPMWRVEVHNQWLSDHGYTLGDKPQTRTWAAMEQHLNRMRADNVTIASLQRKIQQAGLASVLYPTDLEASLTGANTKKATSSELNTDSGGDGTDVVAGGMSEE
ncbi:hypothetical protein LTR08_003731 [Meristemomyces frigidus]|nr:hypothetical protein LTR08_003731 [Meristemomyces frigidus]